MPCITRITCHLEGKPKPIDIDLTPPPGRPCRHLIVTGPNGRRTRPTCKPVRTCTGSYRLRPFPVQSKSLKCGWWPTRTWFRSTSVVPPDLNH